MSVVQIIPGFSLTNRWLLYTSLMLAPAQFVSGLGSNCPSNIGFLAYNWYTQIQWYWAIQGKQIHALSLLPVHFNAIYTISYLGGVTSGNIFMGLILGLGTAGVLTLNTVSAWTSWVTNQPEGFGVYQFFFFGWRTLDDGWHKFILLWQIGDSIAALVCVVVAIGLAIAAAEGDDDEIIDMVPFATRKRDIAWARYPAIPLGAVAMLVFEWPVILWTELIVARNQIESATDMVAVWLFVAQVVAMMIPPCSTCLRCFRDKDADSDSASC